MGRSAMADDFATRGMPGEELSGELEEELKEPELYRVILHNDHYTTMDFVVEVIVRVFHKPVLEATKIMLDVHRRGSGLIGIYPYDIASTKRTHVLQMARERNFPLKCTMEKD